MPRPAVANNTPSLARSIDDIDRSAIMQVHNLHEADLGAMLEIAEAVFESFEDRRFIGRKISCRVEVLQEHETVWLLIGVMLPTSTDSDIEAVVTLNERLAESLATARISTEALQACVVEFVAVGQGQVQLDGLKS